MIESIPRDLLAQAFPGQPRVQAAFEDLSIRANEAADATASTISATEALQDATVIVLSTNGAFTNERVLQWGAGLSVDDDGANVTLRLNEGAPAVQGGHQVTFVGQGPSTLILPLTGTLATRSNPETLTNKTLATPSVSGLGAYANDAAASAGGVPVGGVYRNGSQLMVRVT